MRKLRLREEGPRCKVVQGDSGHPKAARDDRNVLLNGAGGEGAGSLFQAARPQLDYTYPLGENLSALAERWPHPLSSTTPPARESQPSNNERFLI